MDFYETHYHLSYSELEVEPEEEFYEELYSCYNEDGGNK